MLGAQIVCLGMTRIGQPLVFARVQIWIGMLSVKAWVMCISSFVLFEPKPNLPSLAWALGSVPASIHNFVCVCVFVCVCGQPILTQKISTNSGSI